MLITLHINLKTHDPEAIGLLANTDPNSYLHAACECALTEARRYLTILEEQNFNGDLHNGDLAVKRALGDI